MIDFKARLKFKKLYGLQRVLCTCSDLLNNLNILLGTEKHDKLYERVSIRSSWLHQEHIGYEQELHMVHSGSV
jgi:hypothetical protein